jgi:hypothetical protein
VTLGSWKRLRAGRGCQAEDDQENNDGHGQS